MKKEMDVYRKLQQHMNAMPVGLPATESGVEINILKIIFSPEEAEIAILLDYKYKSTERIFEAAKGKYTSKANLIKALDKIVAKGGISRRKRNGEKQYALIPLALWGIYEYQLKRLTPEFLVNFGQYIQNEFGYELASSAVPKMRVIPVEKSIKIEHKVSTYDELRFLIEQAGDQIAIQDCICRRIQDQQGKNCQMTERREVCMSFGDLANLYVEEGWGRKISMEKAIMLVKKEQEIIPPETEEEMFDVLLAGKQSHF